jgi:hypothetical protein
MTRMNEAWAAIVAAIAAGVFGTGGTYIGLLTGRRQTFDQAHVEHQQWLRGQRQDTYPQLLDAFDAIALPLQDLMEWWDVHEEEAVGYGLFEEFALSIQTKVGELTRDTVRLLERTQLLGPAGMEQAAEAATQWVNDLIALTRRRLFATQQEPWKWEEFETLVERRTVVRARLFAEAKKALQKTPAPNG